MVGFCDVNCLAHPVSNGQRVWGFLPPPCFQAAAITQAFFFSFFLPAYHSTSVCLPHIHTTYPLSFELYEYCLLLFPLLSSLAETCFCNPPSHGPSIQYGRARLAFGKSLSFLLFMPPSQRFLTLSWLELSRHCSSSFALQIYTGRKEDGGVGGKKRERRGGGGGGGDRLRVGLFFILSATAACWQVWNIHALYCR